MKGKGKITTKELIVFSMLGAIIFLSDLLMEALPNVHGVAMFIALFTLIYRFKALIPIYVFVFLNGLYAGFAQWWIPYLYIWTILWALIKLIPKKASDKTKFILSIIFCSLHGILFGILYAPLQAIMFGLSFEAMITWIMVGLPFDVIHMCGNFAMSFLIIPLYKVIKKLS